MKNYFGKEIAEGYDADQSINDPAVVNPAVDFLADLTHDGTALELGIGTGRIALPLSRKGTRVHGIDLSLNMVEKLQSKPGADTKFFSNIVLDRLTCPEYLVKT